MVPWDLLKDHRFSIYEKIVLSAIEQFKEKRTQEALAAFIGCSREMVCKSHAKAIEFGVFKTPRFFKSGARDWLTRNNTPIPPGMERLKNHSIMQLLHEFSGTDLVCDILGYDHNDRLIRVRGYWHRYTGRHAYILKDFHQHFRNRIKQVRADNNTEAERTVIALWTEIKQRHERKGIKI